MEALGKRSRREGGRALAAEQHSGDSPPATHAPDCSAYPASYSHPTLPLIQRNKGLLGAIHLQDKSVRSRARSYTVRARELQRQELQRSGASKGAAEQGSCAVREVQPLLTITFQPLRNGCPDLGAGPCIHCLAPQQLQRLLPCRVRRDEGVAQRTRQRQNVQTPGVQPHLQKAATCWVLWALLWQPGCTHGQASPFSPSARWLWGS
jgi:hypothetical protein